MKHIILLSAFVSFFSINNCLHANVLVENLKCEYLENPIGIDTKAPRFSWQLNADKAGIMQRASLILVGTDSLRVENNNGDSWDSGTISTSTVPVVYNGEALRPFTRYFWNKLTVKWDL